MFAALVTGSWVRPNFAAVAPPEPAAWTAATAGAQAGPMQEPTVGRAAPAAARSSSAPANNTHQKPFRSAWMTKERPPTWNRLSPQSVLTPAPLSFTPIAFAPVGSHPRAPAAIAPDRDILTLICVARR